MPRKTPEKPPARQVAWLRYTFDFLQESREDLPAFVWLTVTELGQEIAPPRPQFAQQGFERAAYECACYEDAIQAFQEDYCMRELFVTHETRVA